MKPKNMTAREFVKAKNDAFYSGDYQKWIQLKGLQVRWLYKNSSKCEVVINEKDIHLLSQTLEKKIKNLEEIINSFDWEIRGNHVLTGTCTRLTNSQIKYLNKS